MRLTLFLLVFLAIYASMHGVVFLGLRPLLAGRSRISLLLGLWMGAMVAAPVIVHALTHFGQKGGARGLALVSYTWMGFLFLAFAGFLLLLLWQEVVPRLASPTLAPSLAIGRPAILALLGLVAIAGTYSLWEATRLRVETVRVETDKLPPGVATVRIAQVSDLHLGLISRERVLDRTLSLLQQLQPDLVVATGDLVDSEIDHLEELSSAWEALRPPLGKYAITGNHEVYAGIGPSTDFLSKSGFALLRNQVVPVANLFLLAGVDDPAAGGKNAEADLARSAEREHSFTILLKHRPQVNEPPAFDLQLSGHAHRGQIFPFNLVTALFYPKQNGLYRLEGGALLYASRGTGTWGPPMRLFSPPEITLIEIARRPPDSGSGRL